MADFEKAISITLEHEGGFVNDPLDPGKATKYGISQKAYPNEYIEGLTIDRAKFLYKRDYWDKINGDMIASQKMAESVFDFAVNAGVKTSSSLAQKIVGSDPDGIIGKSTIAKLNIFSPTLFVAQFALLKIERYCDIVDKNPVQLKYLKGWIRRTLRSVL